MTSKKQEELLKHYQELSIKYDMNIGLVELLMKDNVNDIVKLLTPKNELIIKYFLIQERYFIIERFYKLGIKISSSEMIEMIKRNPNELNNITHYMKNRMTFEEREKTIKLESNYLYYKYLLASTNQNRGYATLGKEYTKGSYEEMLDAIYFVLSQDKSLEQSHIPAYVAYPRIEHLIPEYEYLYKRTALEYMATNHIYFSNISKKYAEDKEYVSLFMSDPRLSEFNINLINDCYSGFIIGDKMLLSLFNKRMKPEWYEKLSYKLIISVETNRQDAIDYMINNNKYLKNITRKYANDRIYISLFLSDPRLSKFNIDFIKDINAKIVIKDKKLLNLFFKNLNPKLYDKIPNMVAKAIAEDKMLMDIFVDNLNIELYDKLPSVLAKVEKVKRKCNRAGQIYDKDSNYEYDKDGYNKEWLDENGNLVEFFKLKNDFPIETKAEYYRLYKEYLEEKTSIPRFCEKYGINSVEGFKRMLERIDAESFDDAKRTSNVKSIVANNYFNLCRDNAIKVINGDISVEEFLNNEKINFYSTRISMFFDYLDQNQKHVFAIKLFEYFNNNQFLVNENFITFLREGKVTPSINYSKYIKGNFKMPEDKKYMPDYNKHLSKLNEHMKTYQRNQLYATYNIGGINYTVDDSIIDQAYAYIKAHNYCLSTLSMNYACKQIVTGKIKYEEETQKEKEKMINDIIELTREQNTIEDYIEEVKSKNKNM